MRRVLTLLFVLWACGGATVLGQTSGDIELTIAREGAGWKGGAKISLTGQQLSSEVRDIKVDGNEIQFTISVLESELHFVATLTGERMVGSIDGFQKGVRIAVGGWSVRRKPTRVVSRGFAGSWIGAFDLRSAPQPLPDPARHDLGFNASVAAPAYATTHPRILFDEAHNNPDTAGGRYKPFADLITSDGYNVSTNKSTLSRETLRDFDILVIVNASGPNENREAPAFTREECDAVQAWVTSGGALLLISDHAPFSAAIADLLKRFDVEITAGFTVDTVHYNKDSNDQTELVFDRESGLLGDHVIIRGRDDHERIKQIMSFSGTSLKGPAGSFAFLKLSDTAMDVLPPDQKQTSPDKPVDHKQVSAAGRTQGLALQSGKGRVVVLGEAAMLTAQVAPRGFRFGMNVEGLDNRQLALNIMHWLSGLLK